MKAVYFMAILIIVIFIAGCAAKEASVSGDRESSGSSSAKTATSKTTTTKSSTTTKTASSTGTKSTASYADPAHATEETGRVAVDDSDTGEQVVFRKLGTGERTKTATEKCDLEYPLECSKYFASDGVLYITIKNQGYTSKLDNVVVKLDGEECDPSNSYIETGQIKEFQCFVTEEDVVSGSLSVTYHSNIEQSDFIKKGTIVVLME